MQRAKRMRQSSSLTRARGGVVDGLAHVGHRGPGVGGRVVDTAPWESPAVGHAAAHVDDVVDDGRGHTAVCNPRDVLSEAPRVSLGAEDLDLGRRPAARAELLAAAVGEEASEISRGCEISRESKTLPLTRGRQTQRARRCRPRRRCGRRGVGAAQGGSPVSTTWPQR